MGGGSQSESFKKLTGSTTAENLKLIEPPPKKPGRITAGIVIAVIGVVLMLLGVVVVFVLVYLVVDGQGEAFENWAQGGLRDNGDKATFYLEIAEENDLGFGIEYKFVDAGNAVALTSEDIGDKGDSVVLAVEWREGANAIVTGAWGTQSYGSIRCRIPGVLVIVLGLAICMAGGIISLTGNMKFKKDLAEYRKSFTAGSVASVEPPPLTPPPDGAPPPGQPPPPPPQQAAAPPPAQPPVVKQPPAPEPEPAPSQEEPPPAEAEAPPAETPPLEEAPSAETPSAEEAPPPATGEGAAPPSETPPPSEEAPPATDEQQGEGAASPQAEETPAGPLVVACHACGGNIEVTTDERPVVLKCPGCGADAELA